MSIEPITIPMSIEVNDVTIDSTIETNEVTIESTFDAKIEVVEGGDITVQSLTVTENGTTTAPTGKAYSPVIVNVPNTYTNSDEGKVVQNGALTSQTSTTKSANGTYDTTTNNQVTVSVPASEVDTGTKPISTNGTHDVVGYASAAVSVPNTYTASDEGKVVDSGALVSQTSTTVTTNGTYDTTTNDEVVVNVSGGTPTLITKTITENGTYSAEDDDADGYSEVTVNVSGGDWLDDYLSGRTTEIIYTGTSQILGISFGKATLLKFVGTKTTKIGTLFQWNTGIQVASFPKLTSFDNNGAFNGCSKITTIDLGPVTWIPNNTFNNCTLLNKLILRRSNGVSPLAGTAVIASGTPFKSGGSGGKIYIPEVMYNHLGDGTSMDYKSASNWSVIDGYGTITWEKLEGSPYESEDWAI